MRRPRIAVLAGLVLLASAAAGGLLPTHTRSAGTPDWQEIAWPFGRDGWPVGRAFRCVGGSCAGALEVYVRPKIGLCNCSTGVSGDAEVDAVSDIDLLSDDFVPRGPGGVVQVAGMAGRSRAYLVTLAGGRSLVAAGMALSHRCDLVAAAAVGAAADRADGQAAIATLLERPDVRRWMLDQMGKS